MLRLLVDTVDIYDENTELFSTRGGFVLELEHSLASLSKWESIHQKPFLGAGEKSREEVLSYVECMLDPEISPEVLHKLDQKAFDQITEYIHSKQTATWFPEEPNGPSSSEVITSELIYYWMVTFQIPFECERWHINRLFTLIRVCSVKNGKEKKMSPADLAARNRKLNAERKKKYNTKG